MCGFLLIMFCNVANGAKQCSYSSKFQIVSLAFAANTKKTVQEFSKVLLATAQLQVMSTMAWQAQNNISLFCSVTLNNI